MKYLGCVFVLFSFLVLPYNIHSSQEVASDVEKDISDEEIDSIDQIIKGTTAVINEHDTLPVIDPGEVLEALNTLDILLKKYPASHKKDRIFLLRGKAKIIMGSLCMNIGDNAQIKEYLDGNRDEYIFFHGCHYKGDDLKEVINNYPNSAYLEDAVITLGYLDYGVGECEADLDCHLIRAINAFLPYIQKFPSGSEIGKIVEIMNGELKSMNSNSNRKGSWDIYNIEETRPLLTAYYAAVMGIRNSELRNEALFNIARAFISAAQYKKAEAIYEALESQSSAYRNARSRAAYMMFEFKKKEIDQDDVFRAKLSQYILPLTNASEETRLRSLKRIEEDIIDPSLLFSILIAVSDLSIKDGSAEVRRRSMEVLSKRAPQTSFFRSALSMCIKNDKKLENRYFCTTLFHEHKYLMRTGVEFYNRDKIKEVQSLYTGRPPSDFEPKIDWAERAEREREAGRALYENAMNFIDEHKGKYSSEEQDGLLKFAENFLGLARRDVTEDDKKMPVSTQKKLEVNVPIETKKMIDLKIIVFMAGVASLLFLIIYYWITRKMKTK